MLFNSYEFILVFLPITFLTFFYLTQKCFFKSSKFFLILSSLFFYSWWNIVYLPLILLSMLFNYYISKSISNQKQHKKEKLIFGIIGNLFLLAYFKYSDFFIGTINHLLDKDFHLLKLALPLAISFYTFQQIAYLVDSYQQQTKKYSFLDYALFVSFFPQLIAGPIVHHAEMMPQFSANRNKKINYTHILTGVFIFTIGLFKKVIIADTFAQWATKGFDYSNTLDFVDAWATSLSYTLQLYFDFSGYTDMAIGIALLFNIKLPINFNSPYKSLHIQDFWRRWHITLGRFLKDYIYIPLGGNQKGRFSTYNNLIITFLLGGLWHGAAWTFVFWGLLHGLALVIHRYWSSLSLRLWHWLAWFITFNFINISWVFFRAKSWDDALKVLNGMFDIHNISWSSQLFHVTTFYWIIAILLLVLIAKNTQEITYFNVMHRSKILTFPYSLYFAFIFTFTLIYISFSSYSEFIYFNF